MTALIDYTYFTDRPVYLSMIDAALKARLLTVVNYYQEWLARKVLGDVEYYKFEADESEGVFSSQKWIDFVDGTTYTVNSKTVQWLGFKHLLKFFVYYFYQEDDYSKSVKHGEAKTKKQQADNVSPKLKMIQAWNEGVRYYGHDWASLFWENKGEKLPEYIIYMDNVFFTNFTDSNYYAPTAYNFLYNNYETDYPDWDFRELKKINILGL